MNIEIFIGFVAGFSVLLTLAYMIKSDTRKKRRRIYERIEWLETEYVHRKEFDLHIKLAHQKQGYEPHSTANLMKRISDLNGEVDDLKAVIRGLEKE